MVKVKTGHIIAVVLILAAAIIAYSYITKPDYDDFAKCLSAKNITMYGSASCPHCTAQKKEFGSSFQFINYVECSVDVDACTAAGIEGYPTWIISGRKAAGQMPLDSLSRLSGCPLEREFE